MDIKELVQNKAELIALKKAEVKLTKGGLSGCVNEAAHVYNKGVFKDGDDALNRTIIGNTYLWMDSHEDVHAKNCFAKSIKEKGKDAFHLHDHKFEIDAKVGEPIKVYEDSISWKALGINKEGNTQALFMDSEILKEYNAKIFNAYSKGNVNQHSVGMQYIKIDLAVNDDEFEDEYKIWLDNIESIGNKEVAEEKGYFWYVREAKLIEISAVLLGSNSLTPTLENKEAVSNTSKSEAEQSLQRTKNYYESLI